MKKIIILILLLSTPSVWGQMLQNCSECSTRLINVNRDELSALSNWELRILKNEIYARKGYTFSSKDLTDYFSNYSWYRPLNNNAKIKLNNIETLNVAKIDSYLNRISNNTEQNIEYVENSKHKWLSDDETARIFTDARKAELGIKYPIWKVYSYSDNAGSYYMVTCENTYIENYDDEDPLRDKIQVINFKRNGNQLTKTFEANDFIQKPITDEEDNINVWTRYVCVEDFDGDGIVEPMVIYGARGVSYGYNNSWAKILIYRNNIKTRIWIHNSEMDDGRYIDIDKSFYLLPQGIKDAVIRQMEQMQENGHCYYGNTWKESFAKGKLKIQD